MRIRLSACRKKVDARKGATKMLIHIKEIDSAVENNRCPEPAFCTIATTVYDSHTRERKCLKCWLEFCKTHNIEIDYD